ncbi:MAG: hypothetical protein ACYS6W_17270 [Planctomycetota bacterium]|jgi:hypothetical protein
MITDAFLLAQGQSERVFDPWPFLGLIAFAAFVIFCVHRIGKFFDSGRKEQKLIRMELSKLAEEVQAIRRKLENHKEHDGAADS